MKGSRDTRVYVNVTRDLYTRDEDECDGTVILDPDVFGTMESLGNFCPPWKIDGIRWVDRCFNSPAVIFGNLQRQNYDGACCYSARVSDVAMSSSAAGAQTPFAFLCYAKRFKRELIILDWDYRAEDRSRPGWPANWGSDFGDVIWQPEPPIVSPFRTH